MICLVIGMANAANMSSLTFGEINAKIALLERGYLKTRHGILLVLTQEAVSLMAEAELSALSRTLDGMHLTA